jgi:hypothetical protein
MIHLLYILTATLLAVDHSQPGPMAARLKKF